MRERKTNMQIRFGKKKDDGTSLNTKRNIYIYELGKKNGRKEIIEKLVELLELDTRYKPREDT